MGTSCYETRKFTQYQSNELKPEIDTGGAPRVPLNIYIESSKAVCKIIIKELNSNATGFFLSDIKNNKFLFTNNHVISEDIIDSNKTIIIEIYNKEKYELKLNKNKRYIKTYKGPIDITVIQINDLKELCNNIKFLSIDLNYKMGYDRYLNNDIYLLGYPHGKSVECSTGKIANISENELKHNCNTDSGSSGSPIILVSNSTVIGIHKAGIIKEKINIGTFLGIIFNHNDYININNKIKLNKNISDNIENLKLNNVKNKNHLANKNKSVDDNNKIKYEYYIISKIVINEDDVDENIRIINSYDEWQKNNNGSIFEENLRNENEIKKCKVFIEGKIIPFSYFHKFNKAGTYKIKYLFPNNLNNFCRLFFDCKNIKSLDFTHFNSQNVINMNNAFANCSSLTNINLSNLNTKNVINMSFMFFSCSSLVNLDLSNFNTQNVTDMSCMFYNCKSLTNLDLSNFNTQNVTDMGNIFTNCSSLINLDLSNFNTQNVTNMISMFYNCSSLTNLDLSNFKVQNATCIDNMFDNCSSLTSSGILCYDNKINNEFYK